MNDRNTDKKVVGKAFKVEINGQFIPCISRSGGQPEGAQPSPAAVSASSGASQHNESTIGHNYISELTLRSYVTPTDDTVSNAAAAIASGKHERYTITITEMAKDKSVIKTFVYDNCLLTGMDFPTVDASSGEILCRTTTWKPEILTVS